MRTWVVVAALLGTTSAWAGEPDLRGGFTAGAEVKLPKTAKKQLKQGLKLLDKGEVVPFLERFVHPKDREGMPDLAVVAENVKAPMLAAAMEAALSATVWEVTGPDGEQGIVIDVYPTVDSVPRDLVLMEVNGEWRIRN